MINKTEFSCLYYYLSTAKVRINKVGFFRSMGFYNKRL